MHIDQLLNTLSNLKYTQRMNYSQFIALLFPDSPDDGYNAGQWHLFATNLMGFLWSCSGDKLALLCQYINEQIYLDEQRRLRPYLHDGGDGQ